MVTWESLLAVKQCDIVSGPGWARKSFVFYNLCSVILLLPLLDVKTGIQHTHTHTIIINEIHSTLVTK